MIVIMCVYIRVYIYIYILIQLTYYACSKRNLEYTEEGTMVASKTKPGVKTGECCFSIAGRVDS